LIGLLLAAATSMLVSLFGTRYLIDWLRNRRIGQPIHEDPRGTPRMPAHRRWAGS
jgi:UDP-N-acetylmuramyl pentapeptide phosphotransferase/UDP-N-acetylglucosamine-1-phosphate transferase